MRFLIERLVTVETGTAVEEIAMYSGAVKKLTFDLEDRNLNIEKYKQDNGILKVDIPFKTLKKFVIEHSDGEQVRVI